MSFIPKSFQYLINTRRNSSNLKKLTYNYGIINSGLLTFRQWLYANGERCFGIEETPGQPESKTSNRKLIISESGMKRLKEICADGSFLRITVEGGGCSGFQYKFSLDKNLEKDDLQFGEDQAKIVIDNISLDYCAGATLDYHSELIRSGFRIIENPLAEKGCSCGASFSMKIDLDA